MGIELSNHGEFIWEKLKADTPKTKAHSRGAKPKSGRTCQLSLATNEEIRLLQQKPLKLLPMHLEVSMDELVTGDPKMQLMGSFKDMELLQLFKKVESLNAEEQRTVKSLLDAFVFKQQMVKRLGK